MKYVRQFWIILLISAMGEGLHVLIPLPVPASVYGLVIMLIALGTHIIKLGQVKEAAEFLIEIMPVMFIPAGVGLLTAWGVLKPVCVPIILITVITTVVVMVVTVVSLRKLFVWTERKDRRNHDTIYEQFHILWRSNQPDRI